MPSFAVRGMTPTQPRSDPGLLAGDCWKPGSWPRPTIARAASAPSCGHRLRLLPVPPPRAAQALKRGGGQTALPIDARDAEGRYLREPADATLDEPPTRPRSPTRSATSSPRSGADPKKSRGPRVWFSRCSVISGQETRVNLREVPIMPENRCPNCGARRKFGAGIPTRAEHGGLVGRGRDPRRTRR